MALGGMFMLLTLVVVAGYGIFAAVAGEHLTAHPPVMTWMRRRVAAPFVGLGVTLALADR